MYELPNIFYYFSLIEYEAAVKIDILFLRGKISNTAMCLHRWLPRASSILSTWQGGVHIGKYLGYIERRNRVKVVYRPSHLIIHTVRPQRIFSHSMAVCYTRPMVLLLFLLLLLPNIVQKLHCLEVIVDLLWPIFKMSQLLLTDFARFLNVELVRL